MHVGWWLAGGLRGVVVHGGLCKSSSDAFLRGVGSRLSEGRGGAAGGLGEEKV